MSSDSTSPRPHLATVRDWFRQIFYGICMGAADIVPGISGGTMALILGIYEDFIYAVKSFGTSDVLALFRFQWKRFSQTVSWDFLLGLLMGIGIAFLTLSRMIHSLLGHEVYRVYLYSLFVGMIASSVWVCARHLREWHQRYWAWILIGGVVTFLLTGSRPEPLQQERLFHVALTSDQIPNPDGRVIENYRSGQLMNVTESQLGTLWARGDVQAETVVMNAATGEEGSVQRFVHHHDESWVQPWLIMCGALAVSAMLLPGISGSYLLNILGVYPLAIGALADLTKAFEWDPFLILANLGVGIVIGALFFSRVISWLLLHYHTATLTLLIGFKNILCVMI